MSINIPNLYRRAKDQMRSSLRGRLCDRQAAFDSADVSNVTELAYR
jgi:hypothetical protein